MLCYILGDLYTARWRHRRVREHCTKCLVVLLVILLLLVLLHAGSVKGGLWTDPVPSVADRPVYTNRWVSAPAGTPGLDPKIHYDLVLVETSVDEVVVAR